MILRKGLRALLEEEPKWNVIAEASDGREAIEKALIYLGQVVTRGGAPKLSQAELAKKKAELQEARVRQSKNAEERRKNLEEVQKLQTLIRAATAGKPVGGERRGLLLPWGVLRSPISRGGKFHEG